MDKTNPNILLNPSKSIVSSWLTRLSLRYLHSTGWMEVNGRTHELVMGGRQFAQDHYPDEPERRADFLDGMTFGILGIAHAADVERLESLLQRSAETPPIEDTDELRQESTGENAYEDQRPAV